MSTHIEANTGDIAKGILLPGDPLRAKYIADKYLEGAVCFNNVRGMLGFTGTYKGKRISAMGTGMGIPSSAIYVTELMKFYEVENLVRVGTCGALQPTLHVSDIIIAQGACTTSDINYHIFPGTYCPLADFGLLRAAVLRARAQALDVHVGNLLSGDMFYSDMEEGESVWQKYGVLGVEMEAAALYTLSKLYSARALCLATVSDSRFETRVMTAEERQTSLDTMIVLALDSVAEFL